MPYDVGETLKKCRNRAQISVKKISDILTQKGYKASESTIYSWENGNSQPTPGALLIMCQEYGISDILSTFGYDGYNDDGSLQLNLSEITLIEKYRFISEHSENGKAVVDYVIDREYAIADQIRQKDSYIAELETRPAAIIEYHGTNTPARMIKYFRSVSAGTGQIIFDDVYAERIDIPDVSEYRRVAYAVKVSGHSMEPLYNDGDILLIEPTCDIAVNEIGIFNVNGQAFVKKLGKSELISLNKGYDNIPLTDESICMGLVVDKYTRKK